jgi:hypothetical protein
VVQFFLFRVIRGLSLGNIAMSVNQANNDPAGPSVPDRPVRLPALWAAHGIFLAGLFAFLAIAVNTFAYANPLASAEQRAAQDPLWWWTRMIVFLTAGLVYLLGLLLLPKPATRPLPFNPSTGRFTPAPVHPARIPVKLILFILLVAVAMRAPAFFMPAKNGFDYNRYLWDGAVLAHGQNPYQYTPEEILKQGKGDATIRSLVKLKGSGAFDHVAYTGGDILDRFNHPDQRTPYPPLAQAFFALGHLITPFNLTGWRVVLMLFDALAALAVLSLLRSSKLPVVWWAAYLWNPIVIQETYIDAHLEMVVAAGLIAFAWCLCRKKFITSAVILAAAAAVKIWPAALILFILRPAWRQKVQLLLALAVFAVVAAALLLPQRFATGPTKTEGVGTYLWSSHDNQGAHQLCDKAEGYLRDQVPAIQNLGHRFEQLLHLRDHSDVLARIFGYLLPWLAFLTWMALRPWQNSYQLCFNMGLAMLMFWLLAPTNYPWYFTTVLVFGAVTKRPALLLWSCTLTLTHLLMGADFLPHNHFWAFVAQHNLIIWTVHLPIWILLILEIFNLPRRAVPLVES